MNYENVEDYCTNCEDYTLHLAKYDTHERDSSHDHLICLKCKWEYFGVSGKYHAPRGHSIIDEYKHELGYTNLDQ